MGSADRIEAADAAQRREHRMPVAALRDQCLAARRRETVVTPPSLAGLLDPLPFDQVALLESVEHRVQRSDVETQHSVGAAVDQLRDLVAVTLALLEGRENHQVGAAAFQLVVSRHIASLRGNMWRDYISTLDSVATPASTAAHDDGISCRWRPRARQRTVSFLLVAAAGLNGRRQDVGVLHRLAILGIHRLGAERAGANDKKSRR